MELPGDPYGALHHHLGRLIKTLPRKPEGIVLFSAHWEEDIITVATGGKPEMLYDYRGFPSHTYCIRHDAPGDPALACEVAELLRGAGFDVGEDPHRGWDHGVFVPMMVIDPSVDIPIVAVSLRKDLDPIAHMAVGRALVGLRERNVLLMGSGNSFHNLANFRDGKDSGSSSFDAWLTAAVADIEGRERLLSAWKEAPAAGAAHPVAEHLLPLMVVAGAADGDAAIVDFHDVIFSKAISGYRFG